MGFFARLRSRQRLSVVVGLVAWAAGQGEEKGERESKTK